MSFNSAITSPQYTKLRSSGYAVEQRVSLFSNRVVFKCRVNADLTVGVVFAAFTWNSATIGAYTDVEVGQTILVSPVDDITKAVWRGRVRLAPGAATIYCNETQANWAVGYYVYVVDTFEVWDRLSRPTSDTPPQQRVDFDETYHKMQPGITGLQYVYAGIADASSGKFRIVLNLTGVAIESGSSISSWLISPRAGQATLISGSYSSAVATFDLDPATMTTWGETWFKVTATDSNGIVATRHCGVKITNASHPSDTGFGSDAAGVAISADIARGWTARCPVFSGVDSVLPWTLGVVWRALEQYGNSVGALGATSNIDFIGYLRKDDPHVAGDATYGVVSNTTFELVDVAGRMASIEMQMLGIFNDTTAAWDHINNATIRRAIWHCLATHSTVATLVDISFDTFLSDDRYLFPDFSTQGQNLLTAMNGIAAQVNAALEFGPDGAIQVNRDLRQTDASTRSAAVTVASFNATGGGSDDCIVIGSSRTYEPRIGVLDANGAGNVVPPVYQSRAPGLAQGISQGKGTLANQILAQPATGLATQTEINQRGGNQFEIENDQETLTCDFDGGYNFFIPSHAQWYTFVTNTNLAGPSGINRIIYDATIRWQLESVQRTFENKSGSAKVTATFRRESAVGLPGYSVVIPPQPTASIMPFGIVPPAFGIDPLILPPAGIIVPPIITPTTPKGTIPVFIWTGAQAWISINYQGLTTPTFNEITPGTLGSFRIVQVIADLADLSIHVLPAYMLTSDGVNSSVWYTNNVLQNLPVWVQGTSYVGVFTLIKLTQTPGAVEMYAPVSTGAGTVVYDFALSDQGWTIVDHPGSVPSLLGTYSGGAFHSVDVTGDGGITYQNDVDIVKSLSSQTVTSITVVMDRVLTPGASGGTLGTAIIRGKLAGVTQFTFSTVPGPAGVNTTYIWSGSATIDELTVDINQGQTTNNPNGGSCAIKRVIVNGGGAVSRYSTNYGATFAAAVTVGATPTLNAGFDVQHGNTVTLAAQDQKVRIATALGGAYSDETNGATTGSEPLCLVLPWWKLGSSTVKNTSATQPDYIIGLSAAIAGATVYLVTSTGQHDVTPVAGGLIVSASAITIWKGTRIAVLVSVSGTTHLYTGVIAAGLTVAWTDRGAVPGAVYIRGYYHASAAGPLFIAGPSNQWYSSDFGATLHTRTPPGSAQVLGIEPGVQ